LQGINGEFDTIQWLSRKKEFVLPSFYVNAYAGASTKKTDSPHPDLQAQLRKRREQICEKRDLPIYLVAGTATIDEMARYLPQTLEELKMITGFGDAKVKSYGKEFLELIIDYCAEKDLSSLIHEKPEGKTRKKGGSATKEKKPSSFDQTFNLFKKGMDIKMIAEARNLAYGTIETHMVQLVGDKRIDAKELMPKGKYETIARALSEYSGSSISAVKEKLGDSYSYGELRMVAAATRS
jgi:uncharacterized protein YpbB